MISYLPTSRPQVPNNQFPNGGSSGAAPSGMFNSYAACVSVPAGPLTSCALQPGSSYKNASYCDNADCGPNISTIEAAQIRNNDDDGISSNPPTSPPTTTANSSSFSPRVYPNPWRKDRGYPAQITFDQLNGNTTVKDFHGERPLG